MHRAKQLRKRRTYLTNRFKLIECKVRKMRLHYCVNYQGGHHHLIFTNVKPMHFSLVRRPRAPLLSRGSNGKNSLRTYRSFTYKYNIVDQTSQWSSILSDVYYLLISSNMLVKAFFASSVAASHLKWLLKRQMTYQALKIFGDCFHKGGQYKFYVNSAVFSSRPSC